MVMKCKEIYHSVLYRHFFDNKFRGHSENISYLHTYEYMHLWRAATFKEINKEERKQIHSLQIMKSWRSRLVYSRIYTYIKQKSYA